MSQYSAEADAPPEATAASQFHPRPQLTCLQLKQWARTAQPNARLIYAHGVQWEHASRSEIRDQVLKLQRLGLATSHFVRGRNGGPDHHLLQRTQRPCLAGMDL
jgi:hypothetical protein